MLLQILLNLIQKETVISNTQMTGLRERVSRLKTSALARRDSVDLAINLLDDFFDSLQTLTTSISTAIGQLTSDRPITNDPSLITAELQELTASFNLLVPYFNGSL